MGSKALSLGLAIPLWCWTELEWVSVDSKQRMPDQSPGLLCAFSTSPVWDGISPKNMSTMVTDGPEVCKRDLAHILGSQGWCLKINHKWPITKKIQNAQTIFDDFLIEVPPLIYYKCQRKLTRALTLTLWCWWHSITQFPREEPNLGRLEFSPAPSFAEKDRWCN